MDTVSEYRENLINYITSLNDDTTITVTFEDLLYIIFSSNPREDENLLNITRKLIKALKNNKGSVNIKSLKKLINYIEVSGLNEGLNNEIYNLLLIDQLIKKNENILKEEFDEKLSEMNASLISSYDVEKNNFLQDLYQ